MLFSEVEAIYLMFLNLMITKIIHMDLARAKSEALFNIIV